MKLTVIGFALTALAFPPRPQMQTASAPATFAHAMTIAATTTVNRMGNTTMVNGHNSNTGTSWNQRSFSPMATQHVRSSF